MLAGLSGGYGVGVGWHRMLRLYVHVVQHVRISNMYVVRVSILRSTYLYNSSYPIPVKTQRIESLPLLPT